MNRWNICVTLCLLDMCLFSMASESKLCAQYGQLWVTGADAMQGPDASSVAT